MLDVESINLLAEGLIFDAMLCRPADSEGPSVERRLLTREDRREAINAVAAFEYAMGKDSPAKVWWNCPPLHDATFRALGVRKDDLGAIYACAPFRLCKTKDGARVIAAYPAPCLFDKPDEHWLNIEVVISWNPVDDTAEVVGDRGPQIVGHMSEEANTLFSSPRRFFQQWAIRRAQYAIRRQEARKGIWHVAPRERDEIPGGLVIGAISDIAWQPSTLPEHIQCVGLNPTAINKAIMRAARLPRAIGGAA